MIAGPNWELHRKAGSCSQTGDKAAREERHRDENFRRKRRDDLIGDAIVALADLRRLVKKPTIFKVRGRRNSDSEAKFHPEIGFRFDCGLSELNTENARKLATWILKVSK